MANYPTLGRTVLFRSRTGNYTLTAEIIGTKASTNSDALAKFAPRTWAWPLGAGA